jgi:hypothetical protein
MVDIIPICVALAPNVLHHNNVRITYEGTSNFRMELVSSIPLYFVAMLQFMVIVIEAPFVIAPTHNVVGMRFRPQILGVIQLVTVHRKMPKELNKVFATQPSYPRGRGSRPLEPLRPPRPVGYFGLPMMNLGKPPLPPNKPYRRPLNYFEYVKNLNPNVHVKVFKTIIKANGETEDVKIVNMFSFTLKYTMYNWCNNYMGDYLECIFVEV